MKVGVEKNQNVNKSRPPTNMWETFYFCEPKFLAVLKDDWLTLSIIFFGQAFVFKLESFAYRKIFKTSDLGTK